MKCGFYDWFLYQYLTNGCITISDDHGLFLTSPPDPTNQAWAFVRIAIVTLTAVWNASITNATRYACEKESGRTTKTTDLWGLTGVPPNGSSARGTDRHCGEPERT